jgi:hypothetical protein
MKMNSAFVVKPRQVGLLVALAWAAVASQAHAAALHLSPLTDAQFNYQGTNYEAAQIVDGGAEIMVERDELQGSSAALLEFDISALEPNTTIVSASIQMNVRGWWGSGGTWLNARIYPGHAEEFLAADFQEGMAAPLSTNDVRVQFGALTVDLNPQHVQSLLDSNTTDLLGLCLTNPAQFQMYRFATMENGEFTPITLTIVYVPEPQAFILAATAGIATLAARGRRKATSRD